MYMNEFELISTQIVNHLIYGRDENDIIAYLIREGCHPAVADKVMRLAKFKQKHLSASVSEITLPE